VNFLEANRILRAFKGGPNLPFLLALSGTADPLDIYLRAFAAKHGHTAVPRTLPFGTLEQALFEAPRPHETEVFLLFPWDLNGALNWRSGLPEIAPKYEDILEEAKRFLARISKRKEAKLLYVPAPIPPIFPDPYVNNALSANLSSLATHSGARLLNGDAFALSSFLASGCPVTGAGMSEVAKQVIATVLGQADEPSKVLVTDLDNVMWKGAIGEDGIDALAFTPDGAGFYHFIYQSLLKTLKAEGVILAAVSRNDPEDALAPFEREGMVLRADDFVAILASYQAKSAQISELAKRLNLGLEAFVFIDDNPIELAEVSEALPKVNCIPFPPSEEKLPELLGALRAAFHRETVTAEDQNRTEMYRIRLAGMAPAEATGANLATFLSGLEMTLTIHDRGKSDRTRAVQLINKTNQFNLNGKRLIDAEVSAILEKGGRLWGASLKDRHGNHGEILSCLVDEQGCVLSLVMSCRVFQRRVEHAFLAWLSAKTNIAPRSFDFVATERNEPMRMFLKDTAFDGLNDGDGVITFDAPRFNATHSADLELFRLETHD